MFWVFLAYLGRSRADLGDIFPGKLQARVLPVVAGSNPEFWFCGVRNSGIPEFRNCGLGLFGAVFGCFCRISGTPGPIWVIFFQESCRLGCFRCWRSQIRNSGSVGSGIPEFRNSGIPELLFLAVFGCFGRSWADLGDIFSGKLQARVFPVLARSNPEFWVCGVRNSGIPEFLNFYFLGEPRSGEPIRSPEGAEHASREAASLDDHPKGLSKRAAARGEPREGARYIYILGKYIASLAVPTDDDDGRSILPGSDQFNLSP